MEWFQVIIFIAIGLLLLRFIRKMLFKIIWITVAVVIILYFFTDVNLTIPW